MSSSSSEFLADRVRRRATGLFYQNTRVPQAINFLLATLVVIVQEGRDPHLAFAWLAFVALLATARLVVEWHYSRLSESQQGAHHWHFLACAAAAASGLLWSLGGAMFILGASEQQQFFVSFVIAGLVAGAVPALGAIPLAFRLFAVPTILSVVLCGFSQAHTVLGLAFSGCGVLFLLGMLSTAGRFYGVLHEAIVLEAAQSALVADLQRTSEDAMAASVAKSRFLATVSHELRTPMNGVLGMAQLLMEPDLPQADRIEYARTLYGSGNALMGLLNDILDLSKIEAGKVEPVVAECEPDRIMADVMTLFAESARAKAIMLENTWSGPRRRYRTDPIRLRQMLTNLVSNALKFTDHGRVSLCGRALDGDGEGILEFTVRDTGIGIPADKMARLFQPFSQVDDSNTRSVGGTGLGLSIVRKLAHMLGGDVSVVSEPGAGSTFTVTVRADVVNDLPVASTQSAAAAVLPVDSGEAAGLRVLVVEDVLTNQKVVCALLKRLGHEAAVANNGLEAVSAYEAFPDYDLILMDCQMPEMDGLDATRVIRAWEQSQQRARCPIVALSASAYPEDIEHALAAGMDAFLSKPIALDKLQAMLQTVGAR